MYLTVRQTNKSIGLYALILFLELSKHSKESNLLYKFFK